MVFVILILWIAIYPVDSAIQLLNNRDLLVLPQRKWTLNWIMLSLLAGHPTALRLIFRKALELRHYPPSLSWHYSLSILFKLNSFSPFPPYKKWYGLHELFCAGLETYSTGKCPYRFTQMTWTIRFTMTF